MSNTKIVIDKEQILDIIKSQSINHANMLFQIKKIISEATEIQIDQSIEDAAKEYSETNYFGLEEHDEGGYLGINEKEFANKLIDFATSQQIIEQLRVKDIVESKPSPIDYYEKGFEEETAPPFD